MEIKRKEYQKEDFKKQQYFCLNCYAPIFFDEDDLSCCETCGWRNELNATSSIDPLVIKHKNFEGYTQICYPCISESDISHLPKALREAVIAFLNGNASKKQRDNIRANLVYKSSKKFFAIARKYEQKAKLSEFFKNTNF